MNIEDQVCSLELAKRLKELGIKQESLFSWCIPKVDFSKEENKSFNGFNLYINKNHQPYRSTDEDDEQFDYLAMDGCGCCEESSETDVSYAAFAVAELGEFLPQEVTTFKFEKKWECCFVNDPHKTEFIYGTEANARAKMLIYLLENGLINLDDIDIRK